MFTAVLCFAAAVVCTECTHIFTLEKDFSKLSEDKELTENVRVREVLQRLRAFKVAVHPRMRQFYRLLKRAMAQHARRAADSLYSPGAYKRERDNLD